MNQEQISQILYEMALVTGGETHVEPLITKTLQRLLYHTAFPCGVFLSDIKEIKKKQYECKLEQVVGCGNFLEKKGKIISLPEEFMSERKGGLIADKKCISHIFGENIKYKVALILPVNSAEWFVLLNKNMPGFKLPIERIFEPVLKNFSKTLMLCRDNEKHTFLLEQEILHREELEITLRESKELLRNVLDTVPSRIFWKDKSLVYLGCNNLFAYDAGLKSNEEIIGKTDNDLPWGKAEAELYRSDDKKVIESGLPKVNYEESQTREDGLETWLETNKIPLKNSSGDVIGVLGSYSDITDRKNAEKEIIKAKEEAEHANNAKSDFLSSMSHELRTPLNAILGFSQLMEMDDSLSTLVKEDVKEINKAGHHLLNLINEVLDLAKIETGHIDLLVESIVYEELIFECVSLIDPIAKQHDIQIHISSNTRGIAIRADSIRLKQVIINLLSNAIKYNRRGGQVNIDVNLTNDNLYRISIKDTGTGIKEENLNGLFESFNRLEAENTDIEGTGIGLVITKRLVELMGGKIGVETEFGVGSIFWIEMPGEFIMENELGVLKEDNVTPQAIDDRTEHNVLYIEDNPSNLKLVIQLFSRIPHIHLFTAHTPSLGIELAEIKRPELILLDINLPEMDGYKVLEKLRHNNKTSHIPVVAISANAMSKDLKRAAEAGFDNYLTKPLDVKHFYETVDEILLKNKTM